MDDFLKAWGPGIITAVVIVLLIVIVRGIAPTVKSGMEVVVTQFNQNAQITPEQASQYVEAPTT